MKLPIHPGTPGQETKAIAEPENVSKAAGVKGRYFSDYHR